MNTIAVSLATRITLLTVATLTVMAGAILAPSLPQIAEVFGEPADKPILAKLVLSLPAFAIVLFAPLSGWITDRFGRRRLLLTGLILYVIAGTSGLYLSEPLPLLTGRFFLGMATAMIMTTSTTLISDYFHGPTRGKFLGYQAACMAMGGVVFLPLGGLLAQFAGWHWPFAVYALALPMLLAAWRYLPEPNRPHFTDTGMTPGAEHALEFIRWGQVSAVCGIALVTMTAMYFVPTQLPFHMKQVFQGGPLLAGLAVATTSAASTFVGIMFGKLSRWASTLALLATCLLLMGLGYALIGPLKELAYLWPILLLSGLGAGLMTPTLAHWMLRLAPPAARGRLSGALISCIFLGQFLSPIVMRPLTDRYGIGTTFQLIGVALMALGTCYAIFAVMKRPKASEQPATVLGSNSAEQFSPERA
jgi:MFS family permease